MEFVDDDDDHELNNIPKKTTLFFCIPMTLAYKVVLDILKTYQRMKN